MAIRQVIKKNLIFFIEFIIFFTWLVLIPPVGDRYIEGDIIYEIESSLRYIFGQIRWYCLANGRVLSNFFSFIVDGNIYIRALVNSMLITSCSVLIYKIGVSLNEADECFTRVFSALSVFLVAWDIRNEVYFYATTLYVTSFFLVLGVLYFVKKNEERNLTLAELKYLYIMVFLGGVWIENSSIALLGLFGSLLLYKYIKYKKVEKIYLKCLLIACFGFVFMLASSLFARGGRLNNSAAVANIQIRNVYRNIIEILVDNNAILLCLSVIFLLVIWINKEKIKGFILWFSAWLVSCVYSVIIFLRQIYAIINTDLSESTNVQLIIGWEKFQSDVLDDFFTYFDLLYKYTIPFLLLLILVSLVYVFFILERTGELLALLLMILLSGLIHILNINVGARIYSLAIYLLIALCAILMSQIKNGMAVVSNKLKKTLMIFFVLTTIFVIDLDSFFVKRQVDVEKERLEIAKVIRERQLLGEWDFNQIVNFPEFTKDAMGRRMLIELEDGSSRVNPSNNDVYYKFMLQHYKLDEKTKILFNNKDAYILISKEKNSDGWVNLKLISANDYNDVRYCYVIQKDGELCVYEEHLKEAQLSVAMDMDEVNEYTYLLYIMDNEGNIIDIISDYSCWY